MDSFLVKEFYTIGALKTNRIIYPCGIKIKINEFALHIWLLMSLVHLMCCTCPLPTATVKVAVGGVH